MDRNQQIVLFFFKSIILFRLLNAARGLNLMENGFLFCCKSCDCSAGGGWESHFWQLLLMTQRGKEELFNRKAATQRQTGQKIVGLLVILSAVTSETIHDSDTRFLRWLWSSRLSHTRRAGWYYVTGPALCLIYRAFDVSFFFRFRI